MVNVTTDKCYENREWEWAYREDEPMGGHDPYSSSKGASELVTSAYRRSFFGAPDGPRLASARAGNVIGGGDWGDDRLIPDVVRAALAGRRGRDPQPARDPAVAARAEPAERLPAAGRAPVRRPGSAATAWNFGPAESDARPVRLDRRAARPSCGPASCAWEHDAGEHPHEARYLKVDSSRARARLGWAPRWDLGAGARLDRRVVRRAARRRGHARRQPRATRRIPGRSPTRVTEERRSMPFRADLAPIVVALPTEDRQRSFNFYVEALGLKPIGENAEDGLPEPLQFVLNEGVRLMLIPTVGFGWVTGNRPTAVHGASECLLVLTAADDRRVDDLVERARQAGAEVVLEPTRQPWGYSAAFADPDGHVWQVTPVVADPLFAD